MKDINEYTAEVFRRSENRIKERKKRRNKILALSIPLFVAMIAVISVLIVPPAFLADNEKSDNRSPFPSNEDLTLTEEIPTGEPAPTEEKATDATLTTEEQSPSTAAPTEEHIPSTTAPTEEHIPSTTAPTEEHIPSTTVPAEEQIPSTTEPTEKQPDSADTAPTDWGYPSASAPTWPNPGSGSSYEGNGAQSDEISDFECFNFSLTWNCYGVSSYNSETGELIKTTDAAHPEDYVTTYFLTEEQKQEIYDLIINLNVDSYPDKFDPHNNGLSSSPSMTLILTVKDNIGEKTIAAEDIALTFEADNPKGHKFLCTCEAIQNILTSTDEWKALPDYEFLYE